MEVCRICAGTYTEMYEIFDSEQQDDITIKIQFCTGVLFKRQEGLPSKICIKCLEELHTAYKFKTNCINSEYMLQNVTINNVKEEPDTEMYNGDVLEDNGSVMNGDNYNDYVLKDDDIADEDISLNLNYETTKEIKFEEDLVAEECVRKSKRINSKTKKKNGVTNEEKITIKAVKTTGKKRGPYKKTDKPKRLRKFKFRRLYCEVCNLSFDTKKDSDEHKKEFHKDQGAWICEICGKVFSHRSTHFSHVRSHYPPQFACDHCDYKSTSKYDLVKHVRIHTGSKSYVCPVCKCAYRTSSNLHAHIRLAHEGVRSHACPLCPHKFFDRTKLNRHIDSHNDVKRYSCEVCHACFSRRCYWKKHLQRQHDITVPASRPGRRRAGLCDLPTPTQT